jgi:phosphoribosylamine--glycine ligase
MKILVIGSGGREHALAWKLAQSPRVSQVFVAPGNGGTATEDGLVNLPLTAIPSLVEFARRDTDIAFTVVGPEAPLAAGIVDAFRAAGLKIFGPTQAAAQLESSKDFAKQFMARHGIPTAAFGTFTNATAAHAYIDQHGAPIVVKADGLAAGKGVVVATTAEEAHAAVDAMLAGNSMGEAGHRVVIEECLLGEEASFIVMVDGEHVLALASSQDHKRLQDGDAGPNTGGMGSYSPVPAVDAALYEELVDLVVRPTVAELAQRGIDFRGVLYAGLMLTADGPKVLEFNQALLPRLQSDLLELLWAAAKGEQLPPAAEWRPGAAVGVVMASRGYPTSASKGDVIRGLDRVRTLAEVEVFHAATIATDAGVVTAGGRVLTVTGVGDTFAEARARAYAGVEQISFEGEQYRSDIALRAEKWEART